MSNPRSLCSDSHLRWANIMLGSQVDVGEYVGYEYDDGDGVVKADTRLEVVDGVVK
jgi:hypothetical protein